MKRNKHLSVVRGIRAELLKMKRTPVFWVHVMMPCVGVILFSMYYAGNQIWDPLDKSSAYLQAVAIVYPFVTGMICTGSVQLEGNSGMQMMSGIGRHKEDGILCKLAALLLLSFASAAAAVIGFGVVFRLILRQDLLGMGFYIKETGILFLSVAALYLIHLFLSLQFSKAASIGMGIVETLVSALMLTGLGDTVWHYIPCAWAVRFVENILRLTKEAGGDAQMQMLIRQDSLRGAVSMAVLTGTVLLLFVLWFHRFEETKGRE